MVIRELSEPHEFAAFSRLEAEIWGANDPTPRALLHVFARHGGVVLGAYDGERLVGISLGFPGLDREGRTYLHSHVLGVTPEYRGRGVGQALKRAQWAHAERLGLPYVGWTYDPLMAPNAWFNLKVLGATVADVLENAYGPLDDAINGTLPTHRFWVCWNPTSRRPDDQGEEATLVIPENVDSLRRRDPDAARRQQEAFFSEIRQRWAAGWRIAGVERDSSRVWYRWVRRSEERGGVDEN
ncbi:MAG: GNAT family N-acetyltransferase [Firmicutes bacterium]|nr:GNAT family N-acetyltransferase [Bacillota bacterium]